MQTKKKVCTSKATYWNKERAMAAGEKWGQRVYECPVCFCWHLTTKEDWRDDFIDADTAKRNMATLECKLRAEFNKKKREMSQQIFELHRELKKYKHQSTEITVAEKPQ